MPCNIPQVSATLKVNNADLLMLRYDPAMSLESLLSVSGQMLVNITYDEKGRPVLWMPVSPLVPSNVSYDHWGHIVGWTRGNLSEEYEYDNNMMRLMSVTYADGARISYDYKDERIKVCVCWVGGGSRWVCTCSIGEDAHCTRLFLQQFAYQKSVRHFF